MSSIAIHNVNVFFAHFGLKCVFAKMLTVLLELCLTLAYYKNTHEKGIIFMNIEIIKNLMVK